MRDALGLLTTIGRGGAITPSSLRWFPAVGLALGAVVGGAWWLAAEAWPLAVAAVLVVVLDAGLTGALHYDGLADSADGLLPHATRDQRLSIMRTPDVGAFAVTVVTLVVVARVVALASLAPDVLLIAGVWCASRAVAGGVPAWGRYARRDGIAEPLVGPAGRTVPLALAPAAVVAAIGAGVAGAVAVVATAAAAIAVVAVAQRRIGGFTGDVLGAAILAGETVGLLVAAARW